LPTLDLASDRDYFHLQIPAISLPTLDNQPHLSA